MYEGLRMPKKCTGEDADQMLEEMRAKALVDQRRKAWHDFALVGLQVAMRMPGSSSFGDKCLFAQDVADTMLSIEE